jgi:Ca-activated chloride channel family protein
MKIASLRQSLSLLALLVLPQFLVSQQIIIPEPPVGRVGLFQMEIRKMQVEATVNDQIAEISLDQTFFNPTANQLQGYFMYPIPVGASIRNFTMYINGVETKGELLDAAKARQIYDEILRRFQDPALLEYQDQALLRMRVFPIQPGSETRITLTYTQVLPKDNGTTALVLPIPANANKLGPNVYSAKVDISTSQSLKNIYCPSHQAEIRRNGDQEAVVGLEIDQTVPPTDLQIYFAGDRQDVSASLLHYCEEAEDGFFFLNLSPGIAEEQQIAQKDITFVLDASGSMAGPKMEQAKKALLFCLENLNEGDRFNVVRFSTEAEALFPDLRSYDQRNKREARTFVENLDAIGGTNMEEALDLALNQDDGERIHMIIFLTDGKPTIGETNEDRLLEWVTEVNTQQRRIFTFGIGTELNTHLLDRLTVLTRAYRTYVLPDEDIEVKVSDFFTKVSAPVLTNLEWSVKRGSEVELVEVYGKELPDLFRGGSISLLGKYRGQGTTTFILTGESNGQEKRYEYELSFPDESDQHDFIPPLWGARAVGYLLDQIRLNGESEELVSEVVRLSKLYGIITPYTSYLILEDEAQLLGQNRMRTEDALLRSHPEFSIGWKIRDTFFEEKVLGCV